MQPGSDTLVPYRQKTSGKKRKYRSEGGLSPACSQAAAQVLPQPPPPDMGWEGKQGKKNKGAVAGKCCRGLAPRLPQADWRLALLGVTAPLADTPDFYVFITEQAELRCGRSLVGTLGHLCPLPAPCPPLSLGALGVAGEKARRP